jgi:DNA-directed RNA polymerase specialized sigma24 family protein
MRAGSRAAVVSNEEMLAVLVARTRAGDERAWHALWLALEPVIERAAGSFRSAGRLSRCPDARQDVVVRVMGELRSDGFRRLVELAERLARRDGSHRGWLLRVARNAAVSQVRKHAEYLGPVEGGGRRWACKVALSESPEEACEPVMPWIEGHEVLARSGDVLDLWLRGADFDEIAAELDVEGAAAAARLVRSAVQRLRRSWCDGRREAHE